MKKLLIALLILILCLPTGALAAGRATITQEAFYVTPYSQHHAGEIYCEITNTGDRPVRIESGVYEFYDQEGEAIAAGSIYQFYPRILQPGEVGYCSVSEGIKDAVTADYIDDYSVSIVGRSAKDEDICRLATSDTGMEPYGRREDYQVMVATVTNDQEEKLENVNVAFGAYDAEGNLLYAGNGSIYNIYLLPGNAVEFFRSIDNDILAILEARGISVASVAATAFKE